MEKSAKFVEDIREGHRRNSKALEKLLMPGLYRWSPPIENINDGAVINGLQKAQPQKANEAQETKST